MITIKINPAPYRKQILRGIAALILVLSAVVCLMPYSFVSTEQENIRQITIIISCALIIDIGILWLDAVITNRQLKRKIKEQDESIWFLNKLRNLDNTVSIWNTNTFQFKPGEREKIIAMLQSQDKRIEINPMLKTENDKIVFGSNDDNIGWLSIRTGQKLLINHLIKIEVKTN